MWQAPSLRCKYGPYFKSDPTEQKATIDMVQAALGKGPGLVGAPPLITERHGIEMIASIFGIDNVDAVVKAIADETKAKADLATETMKKQQEAMGAAQSTPGNEPPANKPAQSSPPKK